MTTRGEIIVLTVPDKDTVDPDLDNAFDNVRYASVNRTFALVYPTPTLSISTVLIPPDPLITIFAIASVVPSPTTGQ